MKIVLVFWAAVQQAIWARIKCSHLLFESHVCAATVRHWPRVLNCFVKLDNGPLILKSGKNKIWGWNKSGAHWNKSFLTKTKQKTSLVVMENQLRKKTSLTHCDQVLSQTGTGKPWLLELYKFPNFNPDVAWLLRSAKCELWPKGSIFSSTWMTQVSYPGGRNFSNNICRRCILPHIIESSHFLVKICETSLLSDICMRCSLFDSAETFDANICCSRVLAAPYDFY